MKREMNIYDTKKTWDTLKCYPYIHQEELWTIIYYRYYSSLQNSQMQV